MPTHTTNGPRGSGTVIANLGASDTHQRTNSAQLLTDLEDRLLNIAAALQIRQHEVVAQALDAIRLAEPHIQAPLRAALNACCRYQHDANADIMAALEIAQAIRNGERDPFAVRELAPRLRSLLQSNATEELRDLAARTPRETLRSRGLRHELGKGRHRQLMALVAS